MKKSITLLLCVLFLSISLQAATTYLVQLGTIEAATWRSAGAGEQFVDLTIEAKTLSAWVMSKTFTSGDQVWIAGGTYASSTTLTIPSNVSFYGGFSGSETNIGSRILSDMDENGIIEPWEYKNQSKLTFSQSTHGVHLSASTTMNGFTITQGSGETPCAITSTNRTVNVSTTTATFTNNIVKDCNLTCAVSASPFSILIACGGPISNCLVEKNTVSITTSGSTDCNIQPIVGVTSSLTSSIIRNNKVNLDYSTGTSSLSNTRGLIVMITPVTTSNTSAVSNCVIHNNEIYFKGNTNSTLTNGAIVAMHNSPLISYSYLYNCIIANNKATAYSGHTAASWALKVIYATTNTIAHNVFNNVFWNNTGTTGAVGAVITGTQNGYGVLSNNVGNGGIILNNSAPNSNNLSDLAVTNTGTNPPYFNLPTTTAGNLTDGSVEKSVWSINNSSSYLAAKGTTIATLTTDKAGNSYSTTPARAAGAYELLLAFRSKASGSWGSITSWESTRDNSTWVTATSVPTSNASPVTIQNPHTITIDANATSSSLTINSGAKLTLNSTFTLGVSGNLTINSDADNGTGTYVDKGITAVSGTTTVKQYVTSAATGLTGRNWYISSPLSAALTSTITSATENGLVKYSGGWIDADATMDVMTGYIAKSPAQNTTITFTGGTLNTGNKSVNNLPLGFNLVGNPYPSYVDFELATKIGVENTIWYRSKKEGTYNFHTYNVTGGVSVKDGTAIIPPMQSFWIKTTNATNTLAFTNNMRLHQDQSVLTNRLKVPKVSTHQLLRLQVSNGTNSDELVVYFNENAQNAMDAYDSQKMFNNTTEVPEIYTQLGSEQLVINGMNAIPYDIEIPVGFSTLQPNNFSISASELKNFAAGTRILLIDKQNPTTEFELNEGTTYNFSSETTTGIDRFSLMFHAPGVATGINTSEKLNVQVFVNSANQITIVAPENMDYDIYNGLGQKVSTGFITAQNNTVNQQLRTGIYIVRVSGIGKELTNRVIIK